MLGNIFGKLTVLSEIVPSSVRGHRQFLCICSCGNNWVSTQNNLLRGITSQCGECSSKQRTKTLTKLDVRNHKGSYNSWRSLFLRCGKTDAYKEVSICEEWKDPENGFLNFLNDMGDRPDETTLDRIDNNLGYFKENCRWSDRSTQSHNRRKILKKSSLSKYIGVTKGKSSWLMQITQNGKKLSEHYLSEDDAAVAYDNHAEKLYGDRPNKTEFKTVEKLIQRKGSVNFDRKTNKFRVRVTTDSGRKCLGFFLTFEEANNVLSDYLINNKF